MSKVAHKREVGEHGVELVRVEGHLGEGEGGEVLVETNAVQGGAGEVAAGEVQPLKLRVGDTLHHLHCSYATQVCE